MTDDNVIILPVITRLDIPAERVVGKALEADLESVVIVGMTKDGEEYFASSMASGAEAAWLLQRGLWALNRMTDRINGEDD